MVIDVLVGNCSGRGSGKNTVVVYKRSRCCSGSCSGSSGIGSAVVVVVLVTGSGSCMAVGSGSCSISGKGSHNSTRGSSCSARFTSCFKSAICFQHPDDWSHSWRGLISLGSVSDPFLTVSASGGGGGGGENRKKTQK